MDDPDRALRITNRLAEIYTGKLDREDEARRVLCAFAEQYPEHERIDSVQKRIARLSERPTARLETIPDLSSE